jgi:cytochrome c553
MSRLIYFIVFLVSLIAVMNLSKFHGPKPTNQKFSFKETADVNMAKQEEIEKLLHPVEVVKVVEEVKKVVLVELSTPELQRGSDLYKKCMICHGVRGEGKAGQKAPAIGGQFDWYIAKQINNMKDGTRINKTMNPYIRKLTPEDITNLSEYISKLPRMGKK